MHALEKSLVTPSQQKTFSVKNFIHSVSIGSSYQNWWPGVLIYLRLGFY